MATTFATVVFILAAVLLVVTLIVRQRVRSTVVARLTAQQVMLSTLEQRRARELRAEAETLAESATIKAAVDTYRAEIGRARTEERRQLIDTVGRELDELAQRIRPDIIAVLDPAGTAVAVAGGHRGDWPRVISDVKAWAASDDFVVLPAGVFRAATVPLAVGPDVVGYLQLGTALDAEYAAQLTSLSGAGTLITTANGVAASTLRIGATRALTPAVLRALPDSELVDLNGEQYAVRRLLQQHDISIFVLDSIDASAGSILRDTIRALLVIGLCALVVAGIGSRWLAQTIAGPIDTLSRSLSGLATSRDFDTPVARTGSTLELDTLTETFNGLMATVSAAEAETRSAYVGAIRALALALDARDPYTAGHSERVSAISSAVGERMGLDDDDLEILRLGALLHDIGKIGISDDVLRKAGPLTAEEFEAIKEHPSTGARILRSVLFLAPHLPIVELHHERPDGKGYPHGLLADEIPMHARIVHVADAFDAMTSARAYRPARNAAEALQELWRFAGSQFDAEVVHALAATIPTFRLEDHRFDPGESRAARKPAVISFTRA